MNGAVGVDEHWGAINGATSLPGTLNNQFLMVFFNWMIPIFYMENGCFTKHPFLAGCLGFQVYIKPQEIVQTCLKITTNI